MDEKHPYGIEPPAPLEFLTKDKIHPDNQAILDREQKRWRLLTPIVRWRMKRYVEHLRKQLKAGQYNEKIKRAQALRREFRQCRAVFANAALPLAERKAARRRATAVKAEAANILGALDALHTTAENFKHYQGWLVYEAQHRRELHADNIREAKETKEMDIEAKWLEQIIRRVWSRTAGCHHIQTDGNGKTKTRVPSFERSQIRPDAHVFYLAATRRLPFFGYRWLLPYGVLPSRLREPEVLEALSTATKRQVTAKYNDHNQLIFIVSRLDSPDALPKTVMWRDAMKFFPDRQRSKFPFCVGIAENRKFKFLTLETGKDGASSVMVAGTSGSGKSNVVNGMIATWSSTHSPAELRIILIDQKGGVEFSHWYELPHLLGDVIKTVDQVKPVLKRMFESMQLRYAMMEKIRAKHLADYNLKVEEKYRLPEILIVLDEMNTLVGRGAETEEIHNLISLLASQGRAAGVHLLLCTQHPEVAVVPGRIKTNVGAKVCGYMPSISASQIVLDKPDAHYLPLLPGRFVYSIGLETVVVQAPLITDDDIAGVVSATRLAYTDVAEDLIEVADVPKAVAWNEQKVLAYCLEFLQGQLSSDKLQEALQTDGPGERELRRICRRIRDTIEDASFITNTADGTRWKGKREKGNVYRLVPIKVAPVAPVEIAAPPAPTPTSETAPEVEEPELLTEPAAD